MTSQSPQFATENMVRLGLSGGERLRLAGSRPWQQRGDLGDGFHVFSLKCGSRYGFAG